MSKVIKRVHGEFVKKVLEEVWCKDCGRYFEIKRVSGENVIVDNPDNRELIGKPCPECGGETEHKDKEWEDWKRGYVLVKCDCGELVYCQGFTTTCECGRDYGPNGDQLAPRSQWGEETGEHWSDIINPYYDYDY